MRCAPTSIPPNSSDSPTSSRWATFAPGSTSHSTSDRPAFPAIGCAPCPRRPHVTASDRPDAPAASLSSRFEAARRRLGAIAYRMLGSIDDAQDAVQETWLRLSASGNAAQGIANLDAWLTTVVARICLNTLRDRRGRGREELVGRLPDPIVDAEGEFDPEHRAML